MPPGASDCTRAKTVCTAPFVGATLGSASGTNEAALRLPPEAVATFTPAAAAKAQHTDEGRESSKESVCAKEATSWSAAATTPTAAPTAEFSSTLPAWSAAVGASLRFTSEMTTVPAAVRTPCESQPLSDTTTL